MEQSYGLCGRGRGWEDLGEWHWNMYNIMYEVSCRSRFNARYWMLGAGALGKPRGMVWGGRREEDSGWGTHVYLWQVHFDIWQNQYNIVKLKNKIQISHLVHIQYWLLPLLCFYFKLLAFLFALCFVLIVHPSHSPSKRHFSNMRLHLHPWSVSMM